eukprot:1254558-Lingulodinium_polyedra.AAC.1
MKGRLLANHAQLHPSSVHLMPNDKTDGVFSIRKASPCPSKASIVRGGICDASLRPLAVTNVTFL